MYLEMDVKRLRTIVKFLTNLVPCSLNRKQLLVLFGNYKSMVNCVKSIDSCISYKNFLFFAYLKNLFKILKNFTQNVFLFSYSVS